MESTFSFVVGLLTAALSLLGLVEKHPELPQASREQAQQVAEQAITQATQALAQQTTGGQKTVHANIGPGCVDLTHDLWIGKGDSTTDGEVSRLQRFLAQEGLFGNPNDQTGLSLQPTGYYGMKTAEAVMQWQKARGMDFVTTKSGVGKMTRKKMRCGQHAEATVKWEIGAKIDDNFNDATVTLTLPNGVVETTHVRVRNDCKELNQQNLNDEYLKKVDAGAMFEGEPNVIKPGLACVGWSNFAWYGVFFENGKYYVKQLADNASGLGTAKWEIVDEIYLPPVISSIAPASGPVGTTITLNGSGFLGYGGDKHLRVKNSSGTEGILHGGPYGSDTSFRAVLPAKLCQTDVSYSGKECPAYLDIVPGVYTIEILGWGGRSKNSATFTVTEK